MTNDEVKKKLQWLCERILRCMHVRCPKAIKRVWSTDVHSSFSREAHFVEWGIVFIYDNTHCITVKDAGHGSKLLLHYNLGSKEFFWDQEEVEEYVEEIVNRILVLDRLAEIE